MMDGFNIGIKKKYYLSWKQCTHFTYFRPTFQLYFSTVNQSREKGGSHNYLSLPWQLITHSQPIRNWLPSDASSIIWPQYDFALFFTRNDGWTCWIPATGDDGMTENGKFTVNKLQKSSVDIFLFLLWEVNLW